MKKMLVVLVFYLIGIYLVLRRNMELEDQNRKLRSGTKGTAITLPREDCTKEKIEEIISRYSRKKQGV